MQQLSGLDASFLALETANTTGHVGGLSVLDPSDAPEPLTLARLTEVMAERLPPAPVLGRPAGRAGQPAARPPARPQPPAVGDLPDHRAGQEACRRLHQDPPRRGRRGLWH